MCEKKNRIVMLLLIFVMAVSMIGCSALDRNAGRKEKAASGRAHNAGDSNKLRFERMVSCSPKGDIKLHLSKDNNIYISDEKDERIIYRNYKKDIELQNDSYSIWCSDYFRIQWSEDGQYAYIIDSIYDVANEKLIPLKDCLIFSWVGNRGIYLSDGKVVEGKFWDNGFYGLYTSKCIKSFEAGKIKKIEELSDDRYFIVAESNWDESEKTLFRCLGPAVEVRTAKFKFNEEEMYEKLIRAYQELREDEKAWELLNGEYLETESRNKAVNDFEKLKTQYPVKLVNENFEANRLNWDFDMNYYLVDIRTERISLETTTVQIIA